MSEIKRMDKKQVSRVIFALLCLLLFVCVMQHVFAQTSRLHRESLNDKSQYHEIYSLTLTDNSLNIKTDLASSKADGICQLGSKSLSVYSLALLLVSFSGITTFLIWPIILLCACFIAIRLRITFPAISRIHLRLCVFRE